MFGELRESPSKLSVGLAMALESVGERYAAIEVIRSLVAERRVGTLFLRADPAITGLHRNA